MGTRSRIETGQDGLIDQDLVQDKQTGLSVRQDGHRPGCGAGFVSFWIPERELEDSRLVSSISQTVCLFWDT